MHVFTRSTMRSAFMTIALCGVALGGVPRISLAAPASEGVSVPSDETPPPGHEWKTHATKGMVMGAFFGLVLGGLVATQIESGSTFNPPVLDYGRGSLAADSYDSGVDDAGTTRIVAVALFTAVGAVVGRVIGSESRELVPVSARAEAVDAALATLRDRAVRMAAPAPLPPAGVGGS